MTNTFSLGQPLCFWNTVCLVLNSSLVTWLFFQLYQCSKFTVLCNSVFLHWTIRVQFSSSSSFPLLLRCEEGSVLYIYMCMLLINTCPLFLRIGIKGNIPRIIGEQLPQLIYFMLWCISITKTNTCYYWQYITEHFLVYGYESDIEELGWSITVKFFRCRCWMFLKADCHPDPGGVGRARDFRSLKLVQLE